MLMKIGILRRYSSEGSVIIEGAKTHGGNVVKGRKRKYPVPVG